MKTAIICNGQVTDYEYSMDIIKDADYIICADGGTRHAYKMGICPDLIIGDFDSTNGFYLIDAAVPDDLKLVLAKAGTG